MPVVAINDTQKTKPEFFTFEELLILSDRDIIENSLKRRLLEILYTSEELTNSVKSEKVDINLRERVLRTLYTPEQFENISAKEVNSNQMKKRILKDLYPPQELVHISEGKDFDIKLRRKLSRVLYTPIVDNSIAKPTTRINEDKVVGDFVRVASWNIARGLNFDTIKLIFQGEEQLLDKIRRHERQDLEHEDVKEIKKQIKILQNTDIFLLNEVDFGMPRTNYRNIAEDFAKTLGYNYAYGVEFVEVDPTHLGVEDCQWSEENILFPDKNYVVDREKYRGYHGNAIISRYPLNNVRIIRFPAYYDWFDNERGRIANFEIARRKTGEIIFDESVLREIRRGSRMALVADVEIPGLETPLTVISVHLENRVVPKYRYEQMKLLLSSIKHIENPIVIGGDLNTTGRDGRPTDIIRELDKKAHDPNFIGKQLVYLAVPYSYAVSGINMVMNVLRTRCNPTVRDIPVISPNEERKLFTEIKKTKFADGEKFDYSGYKYKSIKDKWGWLANSNQRSLKGFVPTYKFSRSWWLGQFKLDWLFVKPYVDEEDGKKIRRFTPYFGRTLSELNYSLFTPISDHVPITVDLPLYPPNEHETEIRVHKIEREEKLQNKK